MSYPTPPVHLTTEQDPKATPKRVAVIALILLLITAGILALLISLLPKPAPVKPAPKPATPTVEEPALIEELITLRQGFKKAPSWTCLSAEGVITLSDTAPKREDLWAPMTKKAALSNGGEQVAWGTPSCTLFIQPTDDNTARMNTLITEAGAAAGADEYADLDADGMYLVKVTTASGADDPYVGVDAVALSLLRARDGVGTHTDPVPVGAPTPEVFELLRATTTATDDSLREMEEVSDETVSKVIKILTDVQH
ncbi:hypothetical protein [Leucobacter salsicius]|uniref:hypothetical protein n=1 Tax=Leucobacter salsicius TaxID=664638 RepID=UPI00034642DB|nr:hypothetical protein [Leucobacter salsicius]